MTISGKEVDLKDLLKSMAKGNRKLWIFAGQPRMRLWIERQMKHLSISCYRSASYEAVNWKNKKISHFASTLRSASYEAVNWKEYEPSSFIVTVRVSLVWGCELKAFLYAYPAQTVRSASYEAVNWKITSHFNFPFSSRSASYEAVNWKDKLYSVVMWVLKVSLVWGCELKDKLE